jgi:hypothetical protein
VIRARLFTPYATKKETKNLGSSFDIAPILLKFVNLFRQKEIINPAMYPIALLAI